MENPRPPCDAQFEGMTDSRDPMEKLSLARVLHKAFVEVSEKGAEAAATAALMGKKKKADDVPALAPFIPEFKVERPFVFLIRDQQSGSVLFLGRVVNPKGKG